MKLLPPSSVPTDWAASVAAIPKCPSFMHLHIGFDAADLPPGLELHHIVVNKWEVGGASAGVLLV